MVFIRAVSAIRADGFSSAQHRNPATLQRRGARFELRMDPIPSIGEHTGRILAGIGYGAEEIAALRASAVI